MKKPLIIKIAALLLILFSIVTGLGSFNPFGSYNLEDMSSSSSPLALIVQSAFIGCLLFVKGEDKSLNKLSRILGVFVAIWILITVLFSINTIRTPFFVIALKLALCVLLFCKLPILFHKNTRLLANSLLTFSITAGTIAALFMGGYLDQLTYWGGGRAAIFFENPNSTSTRMAFAFMFILYLVIDNPNHWMSVRLILLALELPILYTIIASGSRGSFIVLLVCLAIYLYFLRTGSRFTKLLITGCCVAATIYFIARTVETNDDFSMVERINSTIETGEDAGRTQLSDAALDIYLDYPFTGVGALKFQELMLSRHGLTHTVHNVYWYVLATSGFIGFIFFGYFLFALFRVVWKKHRISPFGLVAFLGMVLIGSKTGGALTYIFMWYVFAISYSLTFIHQSK